MIANKPAEELRPIAPYSWGYLPKGLLLALVSWTALAAWHWHGHEGGRNLFIAYAMLMALAGTLCFFGADKRLLRGPPGWVRSAFALSTTGQCLVLVWFGAWWVAAVFVWAMLTGAAWRNRMDRAIAEQEAA